MNLMVRRVYSKIELVRSLSKRKTSIEKFESNDEKPSSFEQSSR